MTPLKTMITLKSFQSYLEVEMTFYILIACKTPSERGGGWGRFKYPKNNFGTAVRLDGP